MKGIELPINVLVVVAIAIIVLLALVALYFVGFGPFGRTVAINAAKNSGCSVYNSGTSPCSIDISTITVNFDADSDGDIDDSDTFDTFAKNFLNCPEDDDDTAVDELVQCVRQLCACPGY